MIGSTDLVDTLVEHGLVDEFRPLRLVDGVVTSTGAILATYAPDAA